MKTSIPWLRVFAEGFVIVVSILLAFGIDAWWEGRQDRAEEQRVLRTILNELEANRESASRKRDLNEDVLAAVHALLELAAEPQPDLSVDSLDHLLAGLAAWVAPAYERAALDAAIEGGGLAVIGDAELRTGLAQWARSLDAAVAFESYDEASGNEHMLSFLQREAYMLQIWNMAAERFEGWQTSPTPIGAVHDHRPLLRDREFANLLLRRKATLENAIRIETRLVERLDGLLELVGARLEPAGVGN